MNKSSIFRNLLSLGIAAGAIVGGMGLYKHFEANPVKSAKQQAQYVAPKVRVALVAKQDFQITVDSHGMVRAAKTSNLAAEITGRVIKVSQNLHVGEILEAGDVIAEIDGANYKAALASAQSSLADAQMSLKLEKARAEQALRDWAKLGKGSPPELVARKPQITSAEARVGAAIAAVAKAQEDLSRTEITVPYRAKVAAKFIEVGNLIAPGGRVADVYAADNYEVKLPITMADYQFVRATGAKQVELSAEVGGEVYSWQAEIIRDEGVVDQTTMTIPVIARVKGADREIFSSPPLGLMLEAKIQASKLEDVVVIPRSALRLGNRVLVVDVDDKLRIRKVDVKYTDADRAVIARGLAAGESIVISPFDAPVDGTLVEVVAESSAQKEADVAQ